MATEEKEPLFSKPQGSEHVPYLCVGGGLLALGAVLGAGLVLLMDLLHGGTKAFGSAEDPDALDPTSGERVCGAPDSFDWQPLSAIDPASKSALAKGLAMLNIERANCPGGAMPELPFSAKDFERDANTSFAAHVHHKYSSTCEGESFKVHYFLPRGPKQQKSLHTSFLLEVHHGFKAKDWRLLRTSPRPCDIVDGVDASPEAQPVDSKLVKDNAEFALTELQFQMRKKECLAVNSKLELKRVLQARSSIQAGIEMQLFLLISVVTNGGASMGPYATSVIVEQKCDGTQAGTCARELNIPASVGKEGACSVLESAGLTGTADVAARRLRDSGLFGHVPPDATEALTARRKTLQPRRLGEKIGRAPIMERHIKEGVVPAEYDPRDSPCFENVVVYDQGSCGSCYAVAMAQMIGIRSCLVQKGMPPRKLLEKTPSATASTSSDEEGAARALSRGDDDEEEEPECDDSKVWRDISGDGCEWYSKNDKGCRKYEDYGQRSHCEKTCGTCPVVLSDAKHNPWAHADYKHMPNAGALASCARSPDGEVMGCDGGNTHGIWEGWMKDHEGKLWVMGGDCMPYRLKCWTDTVGGVVNPITGGHCESYEHLGLWEKPCSCIPESERPSELQCPQQAPPPKCAHDVPVALFKVLNAADGLSIPEAIENMQRHIIEHGPIYMSMEVTESFMTWDWRSKPVYTGGENYAGNHAVLGVGWGVHQGMPFWLLRNSWGPEWDEGGYFKMQRGVNLDQIESSETAASMPVGDFTDWSAPFCDIEKVIRLQSAWISALRAYTMKVRVVCNKAADLKLFVSQRIQRREETLKGVAGQVHEGTAKRATAPVDFELDLICHDFGLEEGLMWISMEAQDSKGNKATSDHYLTVPAVPGMSVRAPCWSG